MQTVPSENRKGAGLREKNVGFEVPRILQMHGLSKQADVGLCILVTNGIKVEWIRKEKMLYTGQNRDKRANEAEDQGWRAVQGGEGPTPSCSSSSTTHVFAPSSPSSSSSAEALSAAGAGLSGGRGGGGGCLASSRFLGNRASSLLSRSSGRGACGRGGVRPRRSRAYTWAPRRLPWERGRMQRDDGCRRGRDARGGGALALSCPSPDPDTEAFSPPLTAALQCKHFWFRHSHCDQTGLRITHAAPYSLPFTTWAYCKLDQMYLGEAGFEHFYI
ncbi:PREDICTED: uncharacterized protein LOC102028533 [Chinchilla lanigera]|uniref:uncharacterized protein LOC102028533 n=1 Tax=Chinchilla lanigera TaxID=34839 RepID=UPI00038EFA59|nr:PREDICTED: uncharacterized protein LOC102028533 [Chinchilla lanigera]